jgi:hypothetical protein
MNGFELEGNQFVTRDPEHEGIWFQKENQAGQADEAVGLPATLYVLS